MKSFNQYVLSGLALSACAALALARLAYAAPPVTVTAADPPATEQGTLALDVAVTGSGFDSTASVKFFVTGTTNPGGVTVKKVTFSSSKKLVATIDVADTATVDKFDIEVSLTSGRKGKGTTLFTVQPKQTGKPTPPPPPLPPPASCSGAPGVFPAFTYLKGRGHIERRGRRVVDGIDLYLANSTGTCSVLLLIDDTGYISYRQIGNEARIAWANGSEIKLLRLPIDNGNVVPIRPAIVYSNNTSEPYGINDVELSKDGRTIYFTDEYSPAEQHWQDTLRSIDISSCTTNCTPQVLYTFPVDVGAEWISTNDTEDRLYLRLHDRVPDIRTISFVQKQNGVWSSVRHVVSNRDAAYSTIRDFNGSAIGRWDYQGTSVVKDVLAYVVDRTSGKTIDVIDVSDCAASGTQSCYASGESSVIRSGIQGTTGSLTASFTYTPALLDPAPNLLVSGGTWLDDNESVREVDLDSMAITPLLPGVIANAAD